MVNFRKYILITTQFLFIISFFINCSSKKSELTVNEVSDTKIYSKGQEFLNKRQFKEAASEFDKLFLNYPYSTLAARAEIMTAYSYYEDNDIKKAVTKLKEFIELNPSGELSEYAHYLLAMCYYIQVSDQGRDPALSKEALKYFKIVNNKYPNSKYAKDARLKIQYINNALAKNDLMVGIFYLRSNSPASSIKRFKSILENYQNTAVIPETLYRLCEALLMIGLKQEAIKSSVLLEHNFPKNKWTILSKNLLKSSQNGNVDEGFFPNITNFLKTLTN